MILASLSSLLGSVWFAIATALAGFIVGWWARSRKSA